MMSIQLLNRLTTSRPIQAICRTIQKDMKYEKFLSVTGTSLVEIHVDLIS